MKAFVLFATPTGFENEMPCSAHGFSRVRRVEKNLAVASFDVLQVLFTAAQSTADLFARFGAGRSTSRPTSLKSAFDRRISDILSLCSDEQVVGIDTTRVVAAVARKETAGGFSCEKLKRPSRGDVASPTGVKNRVGPNVSRPAKIVPLPAPCVRVDRISRMESIGWVFDNVLTGA